MGAAGIIRISGGSEVDRRCSGRARSGVGCEVVIVGRSVEDEVT